MWTQCSYYQCWTPGRDGVPKKPCKPLYSYRWGTLDIVLPLCCHATPSQSIVTGTAILQMRAWGLESWNGVQTQTAKGHLHVEQGPQRTPTHR